MFALIYLARTNEVKFINGSGPAPMAATIDLYKSKGGIRDERAAGPRIVGGHQHQLPRIDHPNLVEGKLLALPALPPAVREKLARLGHKLEARGSRGVGTVKAVIVHPRTGVLMGGVSPAGDSYVVGHWPGVKYPLAIS